MNYKKVCLKQDNDSHWYLIPFAANNLFEDLLDNREDAFVDTFDVYRLRGGVSERPFYIPENNEGWK